MVSLFSQGIELAIFGMGTVFLFLGLLVLATHTMSTLLHRYHSTEIAEAAIASSHESVKADPRLIAVISAAIAQHKIANK